MNSVVEGSAKILVPAGKVFYNPAQCVNRDLSVMVLRTFLKDYKNKSSDKKVILEALSATGLRSIRYAKEISAVQILANDIDPKAVELIEKNISEEGCSAEITASCADANQLMNDCIYKKTFPDVIDLDPYGSASPFLDAAVQAVAEGGLLCITCTDMAVLCASYPETCLSKYLSVPVKGEICHEMALRIVLSLAERIASKHKRFIVPLVSCSIDFYVRVFIQVFYSPQISKLSGE